MAYDATLPNPIIYKTDPLTIQSGEPIAYIAAITPGKVLAVKAYKNLHDSFTNAATGELQLVDLPAEYYTVGTQTYGIITATTVTTVAQLSSLIDQYGNSEGWGDDIYITFQSDIGPNVVDILIYIIENWTNGNGAAPNSNLRHGFVCGRARAGRSLPGKLRVAGATADH